MVAKPMTERILRNVEFIPESGCWIWMKNINKGTGYGQITVAGKSKGAHRKSYEAFKGAVPEGQDLDHLCRTRSCVSPEHLEPVTRKENLRRGNTGKHNSAKTHCSRGHEYTLENTYVWKGSRHCKTCNLTARSRKKS